MTYGSTDIERTGDKAESPCIIIRQTAALTFFNPVQTN